MISCPVCLGAHLGPAKVNQRAGGYAVDCPACGKFAIEEDAYDDFLDPLSGAGSKVSNVQRARLSHRVRLGSASSRPKLDYQFVERFFGDGTPGPTPAEQAVRLIELVGDHASKTGERLRHLPPETYALIGSANPTVVGEIAVELVRRSILDGIESQALNQGPGVFNLCLTLDGWARYESAKRGQASSTLGFIAMKFGDELLEKLVSETIKPAIREEIGYGLVDMRDISRAGVIDNIMRAQIRDSAFVIVDLTHDNSGAYWEAGYAEGLGKPVIYVCERQKFEAVQTHFDTNHCTTVMWSADGGGDFTRELIATLRRSLNLFPN